MLEAHCAARRFYRLWSDDTGECRPQAPAAITLETAGEPEDLIAAWPTVQAGDGCGQFQELNRTSAIS